MCNPNTGTAVDKTLQLLHLMSGAGNTQAHTHTHSECMSDISACLHSLTQFRADQRAISILPSRTSQEKPSKIPPKLVPVFNDAEDRVMSYTGPRCTRHGGLTLAACKTSSSAHHVCVFLHTLGHKLENSFIMWTQTVFLGPKLSFFHIIQYVYIKTYFLPAALFCSVITCTKWHPSWIV